MSDAKPVFYICDSKDGISRALDAGEFGDPTIPIDRKPIWEDSLALYTRPDKRKLRARITELEAENATLRADNETLLVENAEDLRNWEKDCAENATLRGHLEKAVTWDERYTEAERLDDEFRREAAIKVLSEIIDERRAARAHLNEQKGGQNDGQ